MKYSRTIYPNITDSFNYPNNRTAYCLNQELYLIQYHIICLLRGG